MSKGSKQRPTDLKAYSTHYDNIFRKTPKEVDDAQAEDEAFKMLDKQSHDSYNKQTEDTK
jgi:hypothetical protein